MVLEGIIYARAIVTEMGIAIMLVIATIAMIMMAGLVTVIQKSTMTGTVAMEHASMILCKCLIATIMMAGIMGIGAVVMNA
jgi:hypothetical protein